MYTSQTTKERISPPANSVIRVLELGRGTENPSTTCETKRHYDRDEKFRLAVSHPEGEKTGIEQSGISVVFLYALF